MKPTLSSKRQRAAGYALLIVLLFTTVSVVILGATMNRTVSTANLNERNNQTTIGIAAAEAATEKVYAQLSSDYILGGVPRISANLSTYQSMYPNTNEDAYWANFSFSDAQGNYNHTYVNWTSSTNWAWWPNIDSQFSSLGGNVLTYRILANVRKTNGRFNITNAVQQDVQLLQIPLFQFAIFYNGLLEFSTAATLTINGPVHANGNIYVGSSSALTFNSDIGLTGSIQKISWAGMAVGSMTGAINYNGNVTTNTTSLVLPIGTNNTPAAVQQIVVPPPAGEALSSSMGQQRYFNKAQLNIIISNSSVTAWVKQVDPNSLTVLSSNAIPWTSMTNFISTNNVTSFYDQREGSDVGLAQIDIGKYNTWAKTNSQVYSTLGSPTSSTNNAYVPNDIWIADYRLTNSTTQEYAIRLTNGAAVPTNNSGLTIATPNPLYIIGNYNVTNAGSGVNTLGTTNTLYSQPCSFISDALTILSQNWTDSSSTGSYSSRTPVNTTVNAAIVAGVVYSTGSAQNQFSGGVHNLPRLLENWSGYTLTLNTSIVNLYNSVIADGLFIYPGASGTYYNPPTRNFNFDSRLKNPTYQPPGTPMLSTPRRAVWSTPPPGVTNYVGT